MSLDAQHCAEVLTQVRHFDHHHHGPGFDRNRYHPGLDYRCPSCEGNTTPPVPSQWDARARQSPPAAATVSKAEPVP
jgi:hypothetical protein